jgi:hypothetical protein
LRMKKNCQISRRGKGLAARRARHLEREGVAIKEIERTVKDHHMAHKNRQNWISMR